jgi:hypothetical protein
MIKIDFEFISTHRNRSVWSNPCLFEVPWSGSGQHNGLNASDPISNQFPTLAWVGENISIAATVMSQTNDKVVVFGVANSFSQTPNYYQGAQFTVPPSFRINGSKFLSQSGGLDYVQLSVSNSEVQAGNVVTIQTTPIPNTLFVPLGSNQSNAYINQYLYNETQGQSVVITGYDSEMHMISAPIPGGWASTNKYSIRQQLPSVGDFDIGAGNTVTTLNLTGIGANVNPGDFIRVISTGEVVKVTNFDTTTNTATVSPPTSSTFLPSTIVELLTQTSDNYRTLAYTGTTVGQHEQVVYTISLVSGTLPNILIKNGNGGYPVDYPFLYVELFDTNHPSQNNLFSNNHFGKSYFKVTTPTGQLINRSETFTKFTGDLNRKTIRFRPTSNFRIVWRLPNNEEIHFEEQDTQSPQAPRDSIQTSVQFNLGRD